ncbi:hypothetical protein BH24ACT22_BH24ACT22_00640 [soil metagenome]
MCYKRGLLLRKELYVERRGVFWAGFVLVLVASAYIVPYALLAGVDAWYGSFLFWTVFGFLAIVVIAAMTFSWRD